MDPAHLHRRRRKHEALAARLAGMSDGAMSAALADARLQASVHGSQSGVVAVEGETVFVKQIALTDLELAHPGSTANLWDLPLFYQYGVGSAGFGAWRETLATEQASAWALSGECPYFPLVHHRRLLPRIPPQLTERQREWLAGAVAYWDASGAVAARLEALASATVSITLFIEHAPQMVDAWLRPRLAEGPPDAALQAAMLRFDEQQRAAAAHMNARGMQHFDLHGANVLTDGEQVYVADFGLAIWSAFDLSNAERDFLEAHRLYDRAYLDWVFLSWLVRDGALPPDLPHPLAGRVRQGVPAAQIMHRFFETLRKDKHTPYPAEALAAVLPD